MKKLIFFLIPVILLVCLITPVTAQEEPIIDLFSTITQHDTAGIITKTGVIDSIIYHATKIRNSIGFTGQNNLYIIIHIYFAYGEELLLTTNNIHDLQGLNYRLGKIHRVTYKEETDADGMSFFKIKICE